MIQVAYEAAFSLSGESQRVAPEVPLERDDRERAHAHKDHTESRLPSRKARVQEA